MTDARLLLSGSDPELGSNMSSRKLVTMTLADQSFASTHVNIVKHSRGRKRHEKNPTIRSARRSLPAVSVDLQVATPTCGQTVSAFSAGLSCAFSLASQRGSNVE